MVIRRWYPPMSFIWTCMATRRILTQDFSDSPAQRLLGNSNDYAA
jgi:hypothetical protein